MPDYNPAVAAGFQPQQTNVLGTLEGISQLQIGQAHAGLYSLESMRQQRELVARQAGANALSNGQDGGLAYFQAGGQDPAYASGLQSYGANKTAIGLTGMNTTPENVNSLAKIPGTRAESETKINEMQESDRKNLSQRSVDLYNNPSAENAQDMLDDHSMHMTPLNRNRLSLAVKNGDTNAIKGMAAEMQGAVMTPEERLKFVQSGAPAQPPTPTQPTQQAQPTTLRSPAQVTAMGKYAEQNVEDLKEANAKAAGATQTQQGLLQLRNDLMRLPQNSGFLTPGEGAGKRAAIAKGVNSALTTAGFEPMFSTDQVAAAEAGQKGTVRMGFDLAKTLGSREAAMIVQQSIGVQPGIGMTPEGNRRIMTSLLVASQRDRDYAQFFRDYSKQNPNALPGEADQAFNQSHPVSGYVDDIEKIMKLEQKRDSKGQSPIDRLVSNPKSAGDFDEHFGGNMSRYYGNRITIPLSPANVAQQ